MATSRFTRPVSGRPAPGLLRRGVPRLVLCGSGVISARFAKKERPTGVEESDFSEVMEVSFNGAAPGGWCFIGRF